MVTKAPISPQTDKRYKNEMKSGTISSNNNLKSIRLLLSRDFEENFRAMELFVDRSD